MGNARVKRGFTFATESASCRALSDQRLSPAALFHLVGRFWRTMAGHYSTAIRT